jgi:hypothetical protein
MRRKEGRKRGEKVKVQRSVRRAEERWRAEEGTRIEREKYEEVGRIYGEIVRKEDMK